MAGEESGWADEIMERWEEIPELHVFLVDVKEKTRRNYISDFKKYLEFTGLTPKELIDEAEEELKKPRRERGKIRRRLIEFFNWLQKNYITRKKIRGQKKHGITANRAKNVVTIIKTFYSKNGFPVVVKLPRVVPNRDNFRVDLSPGDVKKMVAKAGSLRNRALILLGFQSAMDANTACILDIADLPRGILETIKAHRGDPDKVLSDNPTPWVLHIVREKAGIDYHTCLGRDGAEAVILYLWERIQKGEELTLSSPLFVREEKGYRKLRKTKERRIEQKHIHEMMKKVSVESGVISRERLKRADINPCGYHALRANFSRILKAAGMSETLVEYMMGHTLPYQGAYSRPPPEKLRQAYAEYEHLISISSVSVLGDVEAKIEELRKHYSAVIQDLTIKNQVLESRVEKLEEEMEVLKVIKQALSGEEKQKNKRKFGSFYSLK